MLSGRRRDRQEAAEAAARAKKVQQTLLSNILLQNLSTGVTCTVSSNVTVMVQSVLQLISLQKELHEYKSSKAAVEDEKLALRQQLIAFQALSTQDKVCNLASIACASQLVLQGELKQNGFVVLLFDLLDCRCQPSTLTISSCSVLLFNRSWQSTFVLCACTSSNLHLPAEGAG